jgi:hypothetical protein
VGRMALADEGCEIPVEMIGLCWLRDCRRRMTRIRRECPNRHFMTTTSVRPLDVVTTRLIVAARIGVA